MVESLGPAFIRFRSEEGELPLPESRVVSKIPEPGETFTWFYGNHEVRVRCVALVVLDRIASVHANAEYDAWVEPV
jgi:hypothetical protein